MTAVGYPLGEQFGVRVDPPGDGVDADGLVGENRLWMSARVIAWPEFRS